MLHAVRGPPKYRGPAVRVNWAKSNAVRDFAVRDIRAGRDFAGRDIPAVRDIYLAVRVNWPKPNAVRDLAVRDI